MNDTTPQPARPEPRALNDSMLTRESWKVFQIIAEFVEGFERLASIRPSVSIFGSARTEREYEAATILATVLRDTSEEAWTSAVAGMERLLASFADTLLVRMLSDGSEWAVAADEPDFVPPKPPKKPGEGSSNESTDADKDEAGEAGN